MSQSKIEQDCHDQCEQKRAFQQRLKHGDIVRIPDYGGTPRLLVVDFFVGDEIQGRLWINSVPRRIDPWNRRVKRIDVETPPPSVALDAFRVALNVETKKSLMRRIEAFIANASEAELEDLTLSFVDLEHQRYT